MRRAVLSLATVLSTVLFVVAMGLVAPDHRSARAQTDSLTGGLAGPTLQFGCNVVKVAAIDPIFDPEHPHDHVFYGNTGVDADSTYESLVNNKGTSCALSFATSSYWNPVVKDGTEDNPPRRLSIYYQGRGDQTKVQPIPDGLQLLGNKDNGIVDYRCGEDPPVSSPPYGCTADEFRIRVHFPECWNGSSLGPGSLVRMTGGSCPSSHPNQIPSIRMAFHYPNAGGVLEGPLKVSAGGGEFLDADFFHADVFSAPQEPAFRDTIKKCVNDVADDELAPAVCNPGILPETTLDPSGPSGTVASGSGTFTFSSPNEPDAKFRCRVYEDGTTPGSFGACSGSGTHQVSGLESGKSYTFEVRAAEPFGNQVDPTPASRTWKVDTTAPTVGDTTPANNATGTTRNTDVVATFSEQMDKATLTKSTFRLYKCSSTTSTDCTKQVTNVTVAPSADGLKATLNPFGTSSTLLASKSKYKAIVTTGAKDPAGNALDQDPSVSGAQQKVWYFTTGST